MTRQIQLLALLKKVLDVIVDMTGGKPTLENKK